MTLRACEKCGSALALAETVCSRCGEPVAEGKAAAHTWRQLGLRLEKELQWERAGQAFRSALAVDDSDEMLHQLFIANLAKQGLLSEARKYYESRRAANAADSMALRQLNVIKLSADFLATPAPLPAQHQPSHALERWLKPSPLKVGMVVLTLAVSGIMFLVSLNHSPTQAAAPAFDDTMDLYSMMPFDADSVLFDPALWGFQAGLCGLALYFMHRNR